MTRRNMTAMLSVVTALLLAASAFFSQLPQRKSTPKLFQVVGNEGYRFIDRTGQVVIAPHFSGAYFIGFSEGLAAVKIDGQWCYIDETGKLAVRTIGLTSAGLFTEGLAPVGADKRTSDGQEKIAYGYIDRTGRVVIQPQFDETYGFSEGLGRVVVNGKWGFIDSAGRMVIEPQFTRAYWFSEGFASVALDSGARVYVDHTGKVVSNPEYEYTDAWLK